ncbi:MAG: DUF3847 domain-containing protein [Oscillospiraceae bacterium]|nr:DUF3847 domain-containing protein [Oscillospiraceae bacterium]
MTRTKTERIASIEDKIAQLENQRKQLVQQQKADERKARTRRLIQRGAMLEGFIPDAETYTEDEIQAFLKETIGTDFARRALRKIQHAAAHNTAPQKVATKTDSTNKALANTATTQQAAPTLTGGDGRATGTG